jgi:hypothetical protein
MSETAKRLLTETDLARLADLADRDPEAVDSEVPGLLAYLRPGWYWTHRPDEMRRRRPYWVERRTGKAG